MLVQGAVDVGEDALGGGFARGQIVIPVRKNFRLYDRNQTRLLAGRSVSEKEEGEEEGGRGSRREKMERTEERKEEVYSEVGWKSSMVAF